MPPSKLKLLQTNTFEEGINTDVAEEWIKPNQYRHALNIRVLASSDGQQYIVVNPKGTVEIEFDLPAGDNKCIGANADTEKNKFYFLMWNSEGKHGVYMYDSLLNVVIPVLIDLDDTNDIQILDFEERGLILHIDIIRSPSGDDLIYFAQQDFKPKKFNIQKALDKSNTGYGMIITAEDINAYKLASIFPPSLSYFTDTTKETNYLYSYLFKASVRHIYDDGERNNWSEFSTVPLPVNTDPTANIQTSNINNGLKITVETGSSIVKRIEIAISISSEPFVSVITLDKALLGISDNTTYDYLFYNDNSSYSGLDQLNVYRAYSFLPKLAGRQAFTKNAMVYGYGKEGWPALDIDVSIDVQYSTLFTPPDTTNELNDPFFEVTLPVPVVYYHQHRYSHFTLTIGHDVVAGNKFELFGQNGQDTFYYYYTANLSDTAVTVANALKQQLIASGWVTVLHPEDLPEADIWDNTINGDGDVTFSFNWVVFLDNKHRGYTVFTTAVNPVSTQQLKNGGQFVGTQKSGGSVKYGIVYWDEDTRRSNAYTEDSCFVRNDFATQTNGFKKIVHEISIMNQPPVWAKYWELVRTKDLTYGSDFIQFLIQKAIPSESTTDTTYVDLVIGSIYTYQAMYPNTIVTYEFEKNDRVRLMKKEDSDTWYTFLETVVLDFFPVGVSTTIDEDVTTDQTATVTIGGIANSDNIGRYIVINDVEREIIAISGTDKYILASPYGTEAGSTATKYPDFKIVDKRGILRVRKPVTQTIEDNSLIEVYKPTQNVESAEKQFYLFGQKYAVTDWGTDLRAHTGNVQNQDPLNPVAVPAIVDISQGTTYVGDRQLPTNNQIPDTQAIVDLVESASYSDFYKSDMNDNGKIAPEDDASGEKRMGSRLRFSNNYIEGTNTNGLNDFDNVNREDYNDPYGDIMLLRFREGLLYCFEQLKTFYTPIFANIVVDNNDQQILGTSDKLLNKAQYFAWEGGIGNNPESWASDQTWQYFLSPNSGTDCRIGGDGILPISQQFFLDTKGKEYINNAVKYSSFVFGGFDRNISERILAFERFNRYIYNAGFNTATWQLYHADYPEGTEFEVTQQPQHGLVTFDTNGDFVYTPDDYGSDHGYTGTDYFYYRWRVPAGEWTEPKRSCGYIAPKDTPAPASIYYNTEYSENFDRGNCNPGYSGSVVTYPVPAQKFNSPISQADADKQAVNDAAINGQAYADDPANGGTCSLNTPPAFSFVDQTGLNINTLTESAAVVIGTPGIDYVISALAAGEYQVDGGDWSSAEGTLEGGSSVKVRRTTSASYSTGVDVTLTVGGVSDTWTATTKAAPAVNIAWTNNQDYDPNVLGVLLYELNGVEQWRTFDNGTGTETVSAGDVAQFRQISFPDYQPWPDNSTGENTARLIVAEDYTTLYDNQVHVQTIELHGDNYTFNVLEGKSYSVVATTNSTMTGFLTYALQITTDTTEIVAEIIDTTSSLPVLTVDPPPYTGLTAYRFNVLDDANTLTLDITNDLTSESGIDVVVNGGAPVTVVWGATHSFAGITKGNIDVVITTVS